MVPHHLQVNALILEHDLWDIPCSSFHLSLPASNFMHHEFQNCLVVLHKSMLLLMCVFLHRSLLVSIPTPTWLSPTNTFRCKSYNTFLEATILSDVIIFSIVIICLPLSHFVPYVLHADTHHLVFKSVSHQMAQCLGHCRT